MLIIKDIDFEMEQVKASPFFDLSLLTVVNEGKSNERFEMKLNGYSMTFESCIDTIIAYRLNNQDKVLTIEEYIELYKEEVNKLKNVEILIVEKAQKKDDEDSNLASESDEND